jgi:hypothetical protein
MIYVGLDDTDTLNDPGTNQLARHLVRELNGIFSGRMIVRHQLLEDPRVPCTKKNGCASIAFEPVGWALSSNTVASGVNMFGLPNLLIDRLRDMIVPWCPAGSDPGLCVGRIVPAAISDWGRRCQRELVTQAEARRLAAEHSIFLEGLGGTEDGVIGALAAVGLLATKNDGRVVHFGSSGEDWYDVTGCLEAGDILARGIDEIRTIDTDERLNTGNVDVGKRLRPNFRQGKIVLYVTRLDGPHWQAVRVT